MHPRALLSQTQKKSTLASVFGLQTASERLLFTTSFLQREPRKWKMYWNNKFLACNFYVFCSPFRFHTWSNEEIRWRAEWEGEPALFHIYKNEPFGNPPATRIKAVLVTQIFQCTERRAAFENIFTEPRYFSITRCFWCHSRAMSSR